MIVRLFFASALLALSAPIPAQAADALGRLFFNPEQRAQMDLARSKRIRATLSEEPAQEDAAALPETVTYNGVVRRSDGKNTIWLNSRSVPEGEMGGRTPVNSKLRPDGSLVIELPQANRCINLRVGQELELNSGSIAEPYARTAPLPKPAVKAEPEKQANSEKRSGARRVNGETNSKTATPTPQGMAGERPSLRRSDTGSEREQPAAR